DAEPAPALWPQPKGDVEEHTRRGAAGEPAAQTLREARVDFRSPVVEVLVKKDEIEIGGVAQFLAAELAVADDRKTRLVPMTHAQLRPAQLQRQLQHDVGEIGEIVREALDAEHARQILREQAKDLPMMRLAQPVHLPFLVALPGCELPPEVPGASGPVRPCE